MSTTFSGLAEDQRCAAATEFGLLPPTSAEAVLANVRTLLPLVAAEADAVEEACRLTPTLERAFRAGGLFEMSFPAFRGGLEMTLAQQVEVVAELAAVDASVAWNVGVLNAGGYYAARLGDEAYAELYPTRDMPTSGSFHPRGRAQKVEGGFLVTGHWDWGSGSYTAEHVIGSVEVFDDDEPVIGSGGKQMHLGVWLPKEKVEVLHNWQVLGVRGSGSTSYEITAPVFVPEHHAFDREAEYDRTRDPLNQSVKLAHFALGGIALGVARHLVTEASASVQRRMAGRGSMDSAALTSLGQAMAEVDFAYAGVRAIAAQVDAIIFGGGELDALQEARMTAANAQAGVVLRRVMELTTELVGGALLLDRTPFQRILRDGWGALAHTGTRKMLFAAMAQSAVDTPGVGWTMPDDHRHGAGAFTVLASDPVQP